MIPEKSNHTYFPAGLVPRAEAATFPITESNVMAMAVAAPEHRAMTTEALQQVFELASPSPFLYHHTHMDSACLLQEYIREGQEQTLTVDNSSRRSRALARTSQQGLSIKLLLDPLPCFSP